MAIKYSDVLSEKVPATLKSLASNEPVSGYGMKIFNDMLGLKLTETGFALGINNSAWYGMVNEGVLNPNLSILLRLYACFIDSVPRMVPPTIPELVSQIKAIDPSFNEGTIGLILGYDKSGLYRIDDPAAWEKAVQPTRVLAWLISKLLKENPSNWTYIKAALDLEAQSRGFSDLNEVVERGRWRRRQKDNSKTKSDQPDSEAKGLIVKKLKRSGA